MKDRVGSVGILPDLDAGYDEMGAQRLAGICSFSRLKRTQLSLPTSRSSWRRGDLGGKIDAGDRDEGAALLLGRNGETDVVSGNIDLLDKSIGVIDRSDFGQRQFLGQPVLQSMERALRAPARPGANRPRYVRRADGLGRGPLASGRPVHSFAFAVGRIEMVRAAIRIEAQGEAVAIKYVAQAPKVEAMPLFLDQKGSRGSRWWRRPSSPIRSSAGVGRQATPLSASRPDAASSQAKVGAAACAGARRAAWPAQAGPSNRRNVFVHV